MSCLEKEQHNPARHTHEDSKVEKPEERVAIFEDYAAKKKKVLHSFKKKKEKVTDTLKTIHGVLEPRFLEHVHSKVREIKTQRR